MATADARSLGEGAEKHLRNSVIPHNELDFSDLFSYNRSSFFPVLGCRQVVSHQILILTFAGSTPATPSNFNPLRGGFCFFKR